VAEGYQIFWKDMRKKLDMGGETGMIVAEAECWGY